MNLKLLTTLKTVNCSPPITVYSKKLSMIALAVRSSAVFVLLCVEQTNRCRVASVGHLVRCPTVQPHHRTGFSHIRQYFHHAISLERAKLDPQLVISTVRASAKNCTLIPRASKSLLGEGGKQFGDIVLRKWTGWEVIQKYCVRQAEPRVYCFEDFDNLMNKVAPIWTMSKPLKPKPMSNPSTIRLAWSHPMNTITSLWWFYWPPTYLREC